MEGGTDVASSLRVCVEDLHKVYELQWIGPYFHVAKSKIGNSHLKASTLASFSGPAFCRLQYDFLFVRRKSLGMKSLDV